MNKETVCSGIRPTGNLHLGNYFGALRNFVKMQDTHNCFFFIADYHSLTTHPTPENLYGNARQILIQYLAAGLDPEKSTIYLQSDLPETIELYLFLNMNAYLGELERVTSFKDKVRQQPNNVNAGLLTYPTLMAADIFLKNPSFLCALLAYTISHPSIAFLYRFGISSGRSCKSQSITTTHSPLA